MDIRKHPSGKGYFAWDVNRLINLSKSFPIIKVELSKITEIDEAYWYRSTQDVPTARSIAEHAKLIWDADMSFPIILSSDGKVMDGMHRVAKALMNGHQTIDAVKFSEDPEPDFTDVNPDELDYT